MAKEKSEVSKEERKALRKEKKEKKLTEDAGVTKSKSDKKEKKGKREVLAEKAINEIQSTEPKKKAVVDEDSADAKSDDDEPKKSSRPIGALVPFANPLADEKVGKKVFKSVKKAASHRALKRGVKEVVKALRKSASANASDASPTGVVVLAADISPMDVISHIPVLCEDHSIPYIYVTSRAELGMAGQTKRPTSVVMVSRDVAQKKKDEKKEGAADEKEDWADVYKALVKVVEREGRHVKV